MSAPRSTATRFLPTDPREAEAALIRLVTDAYAGSAAWTGDGDERAAIERSVRNVNAPHALGLSPEFARWEPKASAAGVIWNVDAHGYLTVTS